MPARDKLYRFSRTISTRFVLLGIYYTAFFFLFFVLSGETIFTFGDSRVGMQGLSALLMGVGFSLIHRWMFNRRR